MFDLAGRQALVTGASSGLGFHFAKLLAGHGARVFATARRTALLETLCSEIAEAGGAATPITVDVTNAASVCSIAQRIGRVDILVNNAGVVSDGGAFDQSEKDWDHVIDTNLKGMFLVAQAAGAIMRNSGGGAIINIASVLGLRQAGGVLPYAVSKAGVIQMTKSLALEWARFGIRVNALAPGYLETELNRDFWKTDAGKALIRRIPQRRLGRLEDLDGPLLLLAGDASRYMTGAVIAVDGGHLVSSL